MSDFTGLKVQGHELVKQLPALSGSTIEIGDLLKLSGGTVERMGATTDNLVFIGVAKEAHASTEAAKNISVALRIPTAIYNYPLEAATTVAVGDLLQANTTAPHNTLTKSATDAIAMAVEAGTSITDVDVVFMLPAQTGSIRLVGDAS
jgi:uncharacterized RmlC-like cupin family protein